MSQLPRVAARSRRIALVIVTALVGVGTAAVVSVAVAKTFTLEIAKNAKVEPMGAMAQVESIVVTSRGRAVYTLSGDSKSHPKCTKANMCFNFWPPVTVQSGKKPTKIAGISGRLGVWKRNGFSQVTLNGHPLYMFYLDKTKNTAHGEGVVAFGGTWHVMKAGKQSSSSGGGTSSTSTSTTPTYPGY